MKLRFSCLQDFLSFCVLAPIIFFNLPAYGQVGTSGDTTATPVVGVGNAYIQDLNETVDPEYGSLSIRVAAPIAQDPHEEGKFLKSAKPYSTAVMGIYSTRPGVVGRRQISDKSHMKEEVPMAMVGVVPTKVSAEGGAIVPGDLLVTSSKPGYAMKGTDRSLMMGAIIGKSLGHLETGTGLVEVAVSLQ